MGDNERSWLDLLEEDDEADAEAEEESVRAALKGVRQHIHRPSKGECTCVAHTMGPCPKCGHLLWIHSKELGCLYRTEHNVGVAMDDGGDCGCKEPRPDQEQDADFA